MCQEYERAVIFRLGLLLTGGTRGPGVFFILPCVDIFEKIDMRTQTFNVPPQEILTKDSVTVFVNAIMYYKVRFRESSETSRFVAPTGAQEVTLSVQVCL